MEKELEHCLEEAMTSPGVVGVICSDKQGLCLTHHGKTNVSVAGFISTITDLASRLEQETSSTPKIVLESDNINVLMQKHNDISVAIFKHPSKGVGSI